MDAVREVKESRTNAPGDTVGPLFLFFPHVRSRRATRLPVRE